MISARDELLHLIDCLSDAECERALELLAPLRNPGPRCPSCDEDDLDQLVWQDDEQYVTCHSCGFCWNPNDRGALGR
jgi:hypothetical protein